MKRLPGLRRRRRKKKREGRVRDRARRGLALLPSLLTLGNLVCGFYAIVHVGAVDWVEGAPVPRNAFMLAAIAILVAMVFDMLDGRVARMTRTTSDFGAQLDSLADAVTFGVAPGVMVAMLHAMGRYDYAAPMFSRIAWVFGAAYACGAAVRLARFNTETDSHDEEAHRFFTGLPSPAAAGVIATLVLLNEFFISDRADTRLAWISPTAVERAGLFVLDTLPFVALALAYLMCSRFRYVHFANYFLRGRQPVEYLFAAIFLAAVGALFPEISAAVIFCGFALSGPGLAVVKWAKGEPALAPAPPGPTLHADEEAEDLEDAEDVEDAEDLEDAEDGEDDLAAEAVAQHPIQPMESPPSPSARLEPPAEAPTKEA